jgi:hypothetical protein
VAHEGLSRVGLRVAPTEARVLAVAWAAVASVALSCAPSASAPPTVAPPPPPPATFPDDPRPLPMYHSLRLGVSLPLPDGHAWRIDDHSTPELVATHPATRSRVMVGVVRTEEVVGRQACEALALERKLVTAAPMHTLEDAVELRQETFDTHVRVAVLPGNTPKDPVVGHVMAFGGFLRKCFFFDYSTEANGSAEEDALSSRLAVARARILGGLKVEPFGVIEREPRREGKAPRQ